MNIDIITECILDELNSGAEGTLKGISLSSFLQLIEMEKKTCTLTVKAKNQSGMLYFSKGDLLAASSQNLENEEAIYEMLCWEKIVIENLYKIFGPNPEAAMKLLAQGMGKGPKF